MLERIMGTKSKIKILRKMIENEKREFTLEDLVKITKQSFGTVHPALHDLNRTRVVIVRKMGRSKLYSINTRHVLFKKIKELLRAEKNSFIKIAKKFTKEIIADKKNIIDNVKNMILFGSAARGEIFGEKSDIDILIIYIHEKVKENISRAAQQFIDKYDVEIVPMYLSVQESKNRVKKIDRFMYNVLREGIILYGDIKWLEK